jgi:hypothetical protein
MSTPQQIVDLIVLHHPLQWRHVATGQIHTVVWASVREIITLSDDGTWRGCAWDFIREFEIP